MTLTVAKLQTAKRVLVLDINKPFSDAYMMDMKRALRRSDSVLIAEFDRLLAIDAWRGRLNDPANNPFR